MTGWMDGWMDGFCMHTSTFDGNTACTYGNCVHIPGMRAPLADDCEARSGPLRISELSKRP